MMNIQWGEIMKTKIYAHRGASQYAPENTMPAFEMALQMKVDGIETDVQLTKDGIPVLIHDEKVNRTTTGKGFVKDFTLKEIQELDAGSWFSSEYKGISIVTLDEFLQWIQPTSLLVNIELKNNVIDYPKLEEKVYNLVSSYGMLERTVFSSFNPDSMAKMHKIDSKVECAFLTSKKIRRIGHFAKSIGISAIHAKYRLVNTDFVSECKRHKLKLRVYTVNKPSQMVQCYQLGCTAIFTDVPDVAYNLYKDMPNIRIQMRRFPFLRK
jgi:glycerophosphoryl diester phosphodiesterase